MNHEHLHSGYGRTYDLDEDTTSSYLTSAAFKAYAKRIEKLVGKEPLSIADIHRKLGEHTNRSWSMDAIESLDTVEEVRGYITKFRQRTKKRLDVPAGNY